MARKLVGEITHYFPNVGVAVVALEKDLKVGELIEIEKDNESAKQEVKSMQVEHKPIEKAKKNTEIGLKVEQPVKVGALVYVV